MTSSNKRENQLAAAAPGPWFKLLSIERIREGLADMPKARHFLVPDCPVLIIAEASEGRLVLDGHYCQLKPGAVFMGQPGQLLEIGFDAGDAGTELGVYVIRFQASQASDLSMFSAQGDMGLAPSSVVPALCEKMLAYLSLGNIADRLRGEAEFYELLSMIARQREHETAARLEVARLELENHYDQEITIDRLARTAGLSRYHFMRLFKERFGKGAIDYLTELRLAEAKRLMETTRELSLRQIAYRVGYKNESYFSSIFKKRTGFSPAIYLKNRQLRVAAYSWVNFGQLLALQVIPFAAPTDQYWTDEYRQKFAFEVKVSLSHQYDFNREALRQARPDYIVAIEGLIEEEERERLREIAPVLLLPMELSWRGHLRLTAEFLGMPEAAAVWLKRYDEKAAELKSSLAAAADYERERVLILGVCRRKLLVWSRRAGTLLYDDLEWKPAAGIEDFSWIKEVQAHQLAAYGADRMVIHIGDDEVSQRTWRQLERSGEWRELEAVKNGRTQRMAGGCKWFDCPWNEYNAYRLGEWLDELRAALR